jgi:tryptophan-rich hypothetical protein
MHLIADAGRIPFVSNNSRQAMNRINPHKLQHSKWTAVHPRNREKHFLVTALNSDMEGHVQSCILEAVHSRRETEMDWRELKNDERWLMGWR